MAAAVNGINLHGGMRAFGGTFLIFSDYCKPSLRLAALMEWVTPLPYPWCPVAALAVGAPAIEELQSVMDYLA